MTIKFNAVEKNNFFKKYSDKEKTMNLVKSIIIKRLGSMEDKLNKPIDAFTIPEVEEALAELRLRYKTGVSFDVTMIVIQNFLMEQQVKSDATEYILNIECNRKPQQIIN